MARAMNIDKRIVALQAMRTRLISYSYKATQIAEELNHSFSGDRSPEGKRARATAKVATRLSTACVRTASIGQLP